MANPKLEVLTPANSQIIFIDQQPQMAFVVQSMDRQALKNNVDPRKIAEGWTADLAAFEHRRQGYLLYP